MKYWVISAPNEPSSAFDRMKNRLELELRLCQAYPFKLPRFRVGTLDSLMAMSDSLAKNDVAIESVVERLLKQYRDLSNKPDIVPLVEFTELEKYIQTFQWDEAKFSSADTLEDIQDAIMGIVGRIEEDFKIRQNDHTTTKQSVTAIERRSQGNLMTKSLIGIVHAEDYVETEHMQTVFVVVPSYNESDFLTVYEDLAAFVVPKSAKVIAKESDYVLIGVTLFKKSLEDFKVACREKRFTIRDYKFKEEDAAASEEEYARLRFELDDLHVSFVKWCEANFGEAVIAQMHLKAIRSFVESVLRYGLLVTFEVALLKPYPRADSRLRSACQEMFGYLGGNWTSQEEREGEHANIPGISQEDFYPYVYSLLSIPT